MCPHCGRDAPIVYRGVVPCCTACGGLRSPLSGPSVNLAGKPARVGGAVAGVAGALVLLVGLSIALMLGGLLAWLTSLGVAIAVGSPIAVVTLVMGVLLIAGGHRLRRSGVAAERTTFDQALLALAHERRRVSAGDAASALGINVAQADALLTSLAKREPERIGVDVDDQGVVWYNILGPPAAHARVVTGPEVRVETAPWEDEARRVAESEGQDAERGERDARVRR
jgi:hypothetical protein